MSADPSPLCRDVVPGTAAAPCSSLVPRPDPQLDPGRGRLEVATVAGASAVVGCSATPPLHVFTPCARGRSVSALLATYGGGLVAGDAIDLTVEVGEGALATIGTQAQTKVYRSDGRWAAQDLAARIAAGAALALLPEPTSCFAGARYRQRQRFDLDPSGSLLLLDAVTPGRSARGERWAFDAYLSRNDVWSGCRLVLRDSVRLVQGEGAPVTRRMGPFELLATVVAVGPALAHAAQAVLDRLAASPADPAEDVLAAASPLAGGVHLRLAARTAEAGLDLLHSLVAPAAAVFGARALQRRS